MSNEQPRPAAGSPDGPLDEVVLNEVQIVLAEKRTSLSLMRTGIAVIALPLSILTFLIATSGYYHLFDALAFILPVLFVNVCLLALGVYLIARAMLKIRRYDATIKVLKSRHSGLREFVD